ncbi:siderophore-interacting protein [Jatrophihabitans sp. DSM 45814]
MSSVQHIARTGQFLTRVSAVTALTPRMRRIALTSAHESSPRIAEQAWPLGCDIAIVLTGSGDRGGDSRELRRRYTVRSVADGTMVVDAVLHGHGPGSTWAAELRVDDEVTFFGPRGELPVAEADWLVALTDESGLPAIAALAETLDRPIQIFAEIADLGEQYPLPANASVNWLPRDGQPAGSVELLTAALDEVRPGAGKGYAYVIGESRVSVALRESLARFGLTRADVYAKGYWNLNARSTR